MSIKRYKIACAIILLFCILIAPITVRAEEEHDLPPHLIQSVNEKDIYEGLVVLELLECPVLKAPDCELAFENAKNCVVRLNMGNAYGSGIIWRLTDDAVIVATNEHVLEYWNDETGFVHFPQGYYANAKVLGVSENYDVGFLLVENDNFSYEELETLYYACADATVYEGLQQGDAMFCVGAGIAIGVMEFHEGTVGETWQYIDIFENEMLYGYGFAKAGMSGGGTFDGYGHLIGMLSGGTQKNETASVPLPSIIAAYEEITGWD